MSIRTVVAAILVGGALGLAACGNDDGSTVRDLNSESPIPPGGAVPASPPDQ